MFEIKTLTDTLGLSKPNKKFKTKHRNIKLEFTHSTPCLEENIEEDRTLGFSLVSKSKV